MCCSSERTAHLNHKPYGYTLFCHRCGRREYAPHGERSIEEVLAARKTLDDMRTVVPRMPDNTAPVEDGPREAHVWVLKAGLTPEEATTYHGFRWHEKSHRVIVPTCAEDKTLSGVLARSVFGERPKYLKLSGAKTAMHFMTDTPDDYAVVVEDVLSCIAVRNAGFPCIAVLGTTIAEYQAHLLANRRRMLIGWFDNDAAGVKAQKQLRKRMALYDVEVRGIVTTNDPKAYHRANITQYIKKALEP